MPGTAQSPKELKKQERHRTQNSGPDARHRTVTRRTEETGKTGLRTRDSGPDARHRTVTRRTEETGKTHDSELGTRDRMPGTAQSPEELKKQERV